MERARSGGELDINAFLARDKIGFNWPLYADEDMERPIVDRILRYEGLNDDLTLLFAELGVPWTGSLGIKAKSEYRQDRRHYRDVLTLEQANSISHRFIKEIDWHGHKY
jgi:hypothetical protein